MLTKSPCGILLGLIYILEKKRRKSINGIELLNMINNLQNENTNIFIYSIQNSNNKTQEELISFDFWDDLSILENSGRIIIHKSEPSINITVTGSLSAETLEIPENIKNNFLSII